MLLLTPLCWKSSWMKSFCSLRTTVCWGQFLQTIFPPLNMSVSLTLDPEAMTQATWKQIHQLSSAGVEVQDEAGLCLLAMINQFSMVAPQGFYVAKAVVETTIKSQLETCKHAKKQRNLLPSVWVYLHASHPLLPAEGCFSQSSEVWRRTTGGTHS